MVETTKKRNRMLVETLDHIEEKRSKTLELMMEKQLTISKQETRS